MRRGLVIAASLAVVAAVAQAADRPRGPDLGTPIPPETLAAIDLTIDASGAGLPAGRGTVARGAVVYSRFCQVCHGPAGAGGIEPNPRLTGGIGSLTSPQPIRTVSSYWPHAPGVFDYIRRAMPHMAPGVLSNDDTYAVVAYLFSVDGIVPADAVLDQDSLPKVVMPNAKGFVDAPR